MRKTKHWLMTITVLLCSFTASAHDFQVGSIYYNITSAEDLTVEVTFRGDSWNSYSNEYSGSVIIPKTISYNNNTYSVTSIGEDAFYNCSSLTAITLPEGVTSIGEFAFHGCSKLTAITLPEDVTEIGIYAFDGCSKLSSINIPEGVTSIGEWIFNECENLTAITLPNGVASIGEYAFNYCSKLTTINIPESVTSIGSFAFRDCSRLTSINIPSGVTSIGGNAFLNCSGLTVVHISDIEAWYDILFENYDANPLYYAHNLYLNGELVTKIVIPEYIANIGNYAFSGFSGLTGINISKSVTSIGTYAFYKCSSLTDITCEATTPPTIKNSYTFFGVDRSIPVYVPAESVDVYKVSAYWSEFTNIIGVAPKERTLTLNQYGSGTYCSEYALDFSEVEGLKAYAATGYNTKIGNVTLTRVMTSKPGMGLFLKGEPGEYTVPTLESTDDNSLNMLVATLEETPVNAYSNDGRYANYKYTILPGNDEPLFYQFEDASTLSAGKAYLQIPVEWLPATEARTIKLRFDDGSTTDIEEMEIQQSGLIFDLTGRRVASPQKGSLYIIDGKKVIY